MLSAVGEVWLAYMVILSLQTLYSSKVTQSELGVWELAEYNGLGCLLNSGSLRGILLAFEQALTQCTGLTKNPHCSHKHALNYSTCIRSAIMIYSTHKTLKCIVLVQDSPVPLSYIPTYRLCMTPLASGMSQWKIPVVVLSELRLRITLPG